MRHGSSPIPFALPSNPEREKYNKSNLLNCQKNISINLHPEMLIESGFIYFFFNLKTFLGKSEKDGIILGMTCKVNSPFPVPGNISL